MRGSFGLFNDTSALRVEVQPGGQFTYWGHDPSYGESISLNVMATGESTRESSQAKSCHSSLNRQTFLMICNAIHFMPACGVAQQPFGEELQQLFDQRSRLLKDIFKVTPWVQQL